MHHAVLILGAFPTYLALFFFLKLTALSNSKELVSKEKDNITPHLDMRKYTLLSISGELNQMDDKEE